MFYNGIMRDIVLNTMLGPSGLSRAGQEFYRCLSRAGCRVIPFWNAPHGDDVAYVDQALRREMESASSLITRPSPVQFHVGMTSGVKVLKDRGLLIGSVVQEGPAMTSNQKAPLMLMDVVTAPSYFCRNAILSSGIHRRKVEYLPYPLDTSRWNPSLRSDRQSSWPFRFLFFNTAYERKGIDLLVRAWVEEFDRDDNVELTIKSHRENDNLVTVGQLIATTSKELGTDLERVAPINVIESPLHDAEIPKFMASFDALLSPHRAEGFGMNPWYAMALGVPVACTRHGGTMDFATDETAWMIEVDRITRPSPGELGKIPMLDGVAWAEPSIDSLRRQMREMVMSPKEMAKRAMVGARAVATAYSYDVVAKTMESIFDARRNGLWAELCGGRFVAELPPRRDAGKAVRMLEI